MKITGKLALAGMTLALAGVMGTAGAQPSAPPRAGPGYGYTMGPWMTGPYGMMANGRRGPWMMGQNGQGGPWCAGMASHIEGRLAYIRTELKITAVQEPLWTAYAAAARENTAAMIARCTTMTAPGGPAALALPDRLDLHEQFMAAQLDAMRDINKALKPLYETFSDPQKQAASQLFWGPMGMM